jgi:peroxiredoxin
VSVPGAFTPSCSAYHIPPYIAQIDKLADKGVDFVVVIASNDSWVMSAYVKFTDCFSFVMSDRLLIFSGVAVVGAKSMASRVTARFFS